MFPNLQSLCLELCRAEAGREDGTSDAIPNASERCFPCAAVDVHYDDYARALSRVRPGPDSLSEEQQADECPICYLPLTEPTDVDMRTGVEKQAETGPGNGRYGQEKYARQVERLACGHVFHTNCLCNWLRQKQTTCPYCRQLIDDDDRTGLANARPEFFYGESPPVTVRVSGPDEIEMWNRGLQRLRDSYDDFHILRDWDDFFEAAVQRAARPSLYAIVYAVMHDPDMFSPANAVRWSQVIRTGLRSDAPPSATAQGREWYEVFASMRAGGLWYGVFGAVGVEEMSAAVRTFAEFVRHMDDASAVRAYSLMRTLRQIGVSRQNAPETPPPQVAWRTQWREPEYRGMSEDDVLSMLSTLFGTLRQGSSTFLVLWATDDAALELRQLSEATRDDVIAMAARALGLGDNRSNALAVRCLTLLAFFVRTGPTSSHARTRAFLALVDRVDERFDIPRVVGGALTDLAPLQPVATLRFFHEQMSDGREQVVVPASHLQGWPTDDDTLEALLATARFRDVARDDGDRATMTRAVLRIGTPPHRALEREFVKASYWGAADVLSALWSRVPDNERDRFLRAFLDAWKSVYITRFATSFPQDLFAAVVQAVRPENIRQEFIDNLRLHGFSAADLRVLAEAWQASARRLGWGERDFATD